MFQRCLICTDFSDGLHRLINFVPSLAIGGIQQIVFVHSVPLWEEGEVPRVDTKKVKKAEAYLSQALKNVPEGVEVHIEVPSGRPTETIPRVLKKYPVDVIFTGTPIRSLLAEKMFGSTSVSLAKSTPLPLMMLRPQLISAYTNEELELRCQHLWRYLLIPYNDSETAHYLIEQVKHYAQTGSEQSFQQCMLLSVIDDAAKRSTPLDYRVKSATERIEKVKAELEELGLQVNAEVRVGNPLLETLDAALMFDISAIAIGSKYRSTLLEWTAPSFANEVMRRSWHPVVFFSPKK
ncbi:MAG: universal stress protein [Chroococcales cyanobacterium]